MTPVSYANDVWLVSVDTPAHSNTWLAGSIDWITVIGGGSVNMYRLKDVRQPCTERGAPVTLAEITLANCARRHADLWLSQAVQFRAQPMTRPEWWDVEPSQP